MKPYVLVLAALTFIVLGFTHMPHPKPPAPVPHRLSTLAPFVTLDANAYVMAKCVGTPIPEVQK